MHTASPRVAGDGQAYGAGPSGGSPDDRRHTRRAPAWAWALAVLGAVAFAWGGAWMAGHEVAGLAATTDFDGSDNVFLGLLFGQGALMATWLARGRAALRRRRQLVAIALGLLAISSLLFGARGTIFMLLVEVAMLASFPRRGHY